MDLIFLTSGEHVDLSAAFLTLNSDEYVATVEGAVQKGLKICAHPTLRTELEIAHPTAHFVFSDAGEEYHSVLDDYNANKCAVMAVGEIDTRNDVQLMNMFCKKDVLFTQSVFIENVSLVHFHMILAIICAISDQVMFYL